MRRNCENCGEEFNAPPSKIATGGGKFCSRRCSSRKHGHAAKGGTRTYNTWVNMVQRCTQPKSTKYYMYGAIGITVCDSWLTFEGFLADMGKRPEGKTLDRIDGAAGYCKENCRWATLTEQQSNLKTNRIITYYGEKYTLAELSRKLNISACTLGYRVANWPVEKWGKLTKK